MLRTTSYLLTRRKRHELIDAIMDEFFKYDPETNTEFIINAAVIDICNYILHYKKRR